MPGFSEVLTKPANEFEKPPLMPVGPYVWAIHKPAEIRDINEELEALEFVAKCVRPTEDIDPDDLRDYGGDVANQFRRVSFLASKKDEAEAAKAQYRAVQFLTKHCGLDESMSLQEMMTKCVGAQFLGVITYKADKNDKENIRDNITSTAPVE